MSVEKHADEESKPENELSSIDLLSLHEEHAGRLVIDPG